MSKKIINVGASPGNLGDGDTLRDAFIKTNANFDQLYAVHWVTDTTLTHDDPTTDGTIAKALLDAGTAGGGLVLLGPGEFSCPATTLEIPENVILKGVGRRATTIRIKGPQDGILLRKWFSGVESLRVHLENPYGGNGITVTTNYTHLRDLLFTGGNPSSWGINADRANVCKIDNVAMGMVGPLPFNGNGIIFQLSDPINYPYNYGDSLLVKVDITLHTANTTGIKFYGPENSDNLINNVLLNQVEVIGTGSAGGCVGVHLRNTKRITFNHVDLENLGIAILEESAGTGSNVSSNNVYMSTFVFGSATSYASSGVVHRRLFLGCDNLTPDALGDTDVMLPQSLWLSDDHCRIDGPSPGLLKIDNGTQNNGLLMDVGSTNPSIKPVSASGTARLTLGRDDSQGVECLPGIVLQPHSSPIPGAVDGTVAQFTAGVVGAQRGLYQLRGGSWVFIG